ncbi:unnamed protein product, partial [Ectocarpus sp. 8 AP-2014]
SFHCIHSVPRTGSISVTDRIAYFLRTPATTREAVPSSQSSQNAQPLQPQHDDDDDEQPLQPRDDDKRSKDVAQLVVRLQQLDIPCSQEKTWHDVLLLLKYIVLLQCTR